MTLEEWIEEEKKRIERFRAMWEENRRRRPSLFPAEMDPGEWDEQYRAWGDEAE